MGWLSLFALATALALDAFAVAIVTGLSLKPVTMRHVFRLAFHFGLFQSLMPTIGWAAGSAAHRHVSALDHWIAFGLLVLIGGRMVWGALCREVNRERTARDMTTGWTLVVLSVATSIDALAVGLSLAMISAPIFVPAAVIGLVAAAFTAVGMILGRRIGAKWGNRVEAIGGLVLVAIGIKILVQHMLSY